MKYMHTSQAICLSTILLAMLACGTETKTQDSNSPAPATQKSEHTAAEKLNKEQQAWQLVQDGAVLIDVRSQKEYDQGHLENVLLINHENIRQGVIDAGIKKEQTIVLYCRSGGRAERARQVLQQAGYAQVFNAGGYEKMLTAKMTETSP
ncbi:MAG: rhodanese-like domain-containing protein [Planctomycetes bacterium]|nr:rhodanese-like domain-containing protein [Planctomycetota bacterium]